MTDFTCLPAGSIEKTTSAPEAASSAEVAAVAPAATTSESAASERSNADTDQPALSRFLAIGPPIFPRPINAMLGMAPPNLFLLVRHYYQG